MPKEFRLYKPTGSGQGCASKWNVSYKQNTKYPQWMMFLEMAKQTEKDADGNDRFDWDNAIRVKLGEADLGELIAVLEGRKSSVGTKGMLYHQSPDGGNKVIKLETSDKGGYALNVSAQDKDKNATKLYHSITDGEAALLCVLLKRAVEVMYEW